MIQIIAGVKVPERLEFGNEEHIKITRLVEKRLELINEGIECPDCNGRMQTCPNVEDNYIEFFCSCGKDIMTDLDGERIL